MTVHTKTNNKMELEQIRKIEAQIVESTGRPFYYESEKDGIFFFLDEDSTSLFIANSQGEKIAQVNIQHASNMYNMLAMLNLDLI